MSYSPSILDIEGLNRFVFENVDSQIHLGFWPLDEVDQTEIQEDNAMTENGRQLNYKPFFYSQGNYECFEEHRNKSSDQVTSPYFSTQDDGITYIKPNFSTKSKKLSPSKKRQSLLTSSANSYIVRRNRPKQGRLLIKIDIRELDHVDKNKKNEACLSAQYVVEEPYDDVMDITEALIKKISKKVCDTE